MTQNTNLFFFIGLAMLGLGIYSTLYQRKFVKNGLITKGHVVEIVPSESSSHTFSPRVIFKDNTNREISFISKVASSHPNNHVGQEVNVIYSPQFPHDAEINHWLNLWGGPIILLFLGTIFIALSGHPFITYIIEITQNLFL